MKDVVRGTWAYTRTCWRLDPRRAWISLALMLAQAAALPLAAPALAALTDAAVAHDADGATWAAVAVAVTVIASLTAGHFAHIFYFELAETATGNLDRRLIELANGSTSIEHMERPEYADRIQVLRTEINRAGFQALQAVLAAVGLGLAIAITGVLLGRLDPWLLLLPLAAVPPLLLGRRAESILGRSRDDAAQDGRRARHLLELGTGAGPAKELRVAGLAGVVRSRFAAAWDGASRTLVRAEARALWPRLLGQVVFAAAYVGATLLVVRNAVAGRGTAGDVILVLTLAAQVNGQVVAAVSVLQTLQRTATAMVGLGWVEDLVTAPPAHGLPEDAPVPARLTGGIRLTGVAFTYPGTDRPVLAGVDLDLPAGTTVAVVGENGAGKSTLVKLLARFYEPTTGAITVDGVDLRRIPVRGWRERIAAGFQDFARLEFLARETVGVGDLPRIDSEAAVLDALDRADAGALLDRLEDGLDTQLGLSADGTELSGGQWQKLALGRAMMRTSPLLLLLDEPTSALDAQAEHQLFERYAHTAREVGARTGAITVLVSHRFSTVRMADLILVVADGRIVEAGTHEDLVTADGLYAELYGLQAAAYS
ncbi:ABC transporter ATP-binding protein [Actinotalea fermentans]|uniref:ABC transporter permease n=1 Tax=Actinotalea fermentans TaxID=43671 RepID=A0A511YWT0_9CELL|nr:ABC transporter ATP-binding protein [Actinotalea fermentans]GEN79586.1 ABC transporter permease [Actinotalea fermentans]